jgi:SAM-dependent methyltransferase
MPTKEGPRLSPNAASLPCLGQTVERSRPAEFVRMQEQQPSIATDAAPECVLCGSPGNVQHEKLVDRLYGAPGKWNLRRCSNPNCRLGWVDPQPVRSDIGKLYRDYWTHGSAESPPPRPDAQLSSATKRRLKQAAALLIPWRRAALLSDSRYLAGRSPGRLLDVGCGSGEFLAGMAALGWEATGVEFDEAAVESARRHPGVKVFAGSLSEQHFAGNSFDAITLSNVIEHLPDPVEFFAELQRVLAPGGRLAIITPNVNSLGHRAFGRCWRGLEPPRHLYLYNPATISSLAKRTGLRAEACFTVPASSSQILEGSLDLWMRVSRTETAPRIRGLKLRELLSTLVNGETGEFVVLLASK